ncbi:hypothetical protein BDK51DRAFT_34423, partial [Blyttiomyces helicus]
RWLLDSGATSTVVKSRKHFSSDYNQTSSSVTIGNGKNIPIVGTGTLSSFFPAGPAAVTSSYAKTSSSIAPSSTPSGISTVAAIHVPDIAALLMSTGALADAGSESHFARTQATLHDESTGAIVGVAPREGGNYYFYTKTAVTTTAIADGDKSRSLLHTSQPAIALAASDLFAFAAMAAVEAPKSDSHKVFVAKTDAALRQSTMIPKYSTSASATSATALCGPSLPINGFLRWNRSGEDILGVFQTFMVNIVFFHGWGVGTLRTDCAKDFVSATCTSQLREARIRHETTVPYSSAHDGSITVPDVEMALAAVIDDPEPLTLEEALCRPDAARWQEAIDKEFASLLRHGTCVLKLYLLGAKRVGCRWVFA